MKRYIRHLNYADYLDGSCVVYNGNNSYHIWYDKTIYYIPDVLTVNRYIHEETNTVFIIIFDLNEGSKKIYEEVEL